MKDKYKYSALNIYSGKLITIWSNKNYSKHEIVNGEWDIYECYYQFGVLF